MKRRNILATAGVFLTGPLAGCLSVFDSSSQLGGVLVANYTEHPRTVRVTVLDSGSKVHSETIEIGAGENGTPVQSSVDCGWSDSGTFKIKAKVLEDGIEDQIELSDKECGRVAIMVNAFDYDPLQMVVVDCQKVDTTMDGISSCLDSNS